MLRSSIMSSSDQARVTVYLSKDEKKWLQRIASDNLRSMASEARLMVLAGIKHYKEDHGISNVHNDEIGNSDDNSED